MKANTTSENQPRRKFTSLVSSAVLALALFASLMPAPAEAATKPYPLKVCIVSGNELGSMGKVITKTHGDQEIKLCCKPCIKKFDKEPAKYLAKL